MFEHVIRPWMTALNATWSWGNWFRLLFRQHMLGLARIYSKEDTHYLYPLRFCLRENRGIVKERKLIEAFVTT